MQTAITSRREELEKVLSAIQGVKKAYFQPPPSVKLKFPCIVYSRSGSTSTFADDSPYHNRRRYTVIVIDPDPDTEIPDLVARLPMCTEDRPYTANNLHHFPFTLYF